VHHRIIVINNLLFIVGVCCAQFRCLRADKRRRNKRETKYAGREKFFRRWIVHEAKIFHDLSSAISDIECVKVTQILFEIKQHLQWLIFCVFMLIFLLSILFIFSLLHCCHDASVASHSSSDGNSLQQCEEQMPHSSA